MAIQPGDRPKGLYRLRYCHDFSEGCRMSRIKLDSIDLKILATLQREGRITKLALAEKVSLSPTPCWERLKRLEAAGIISGYHARIELRRLAPATTVIAEVTLRSHRQEDFAAFEARIRAIPEILECWAVGGGVDYILKVVTPDVDAYQRLIDRLLDYGLGIDRYFTYIVTKPVKDSAELPLEQLIDAAQARAAL
jgi:Lrp/AsnC family transcriptional regulator of ectoine degradation